MVMNQNQAILWIDSGDTLVDESTEIRPDESGVVFEAKLSEGAAETLRLLKREGYRIALVADGLAQSFENIYTKYNLRELFDAWIISEKVGCEKPSCEMFEAALEAMDLTEADKCRIVMSYTERYKVINRCKIAVIYICLILCKHSVQTSV